MKRYGHVGGREESNDDLRGDLEVKSHGEVGLNEELVLAIDERTIGRRVTNDNKINKEEERRKA